MMKDSKSLRRALELWAIWNLVTDVGLVLVWPIMLLALVFSGMLNEAGRLDSSVMFLVGALTGLLGGMVMGLCQWLVLRTKIIRASRWIWATTLVWAIWICGSFMTLKVVGSEDFLTAGFVAIATAVGGGIVGLAQWMVLRHEVRGSGWRKMDPPRKREKSTGIQWSERSRTTPRATAAAWSICPSRISS